MGNLFKPAKFHLARGNGKSSMSEQLCEAIIRADVYQRFDFFKTTVYFYSQNQEAPLTDEEKSQIINHIHSIMPGLKVAFEEGKYPLDIRDTEKKMPDWLKKNPHIHKSEDLVDEEGNPV